MSNTLPASGASMTMKSYGHRTRPGARPGVIEAPQGAVTPRLRVTCYDRDGVVDYKDCDLQKVREIRGKHDVTWIDIVGLGDAKLIASVGEMFHLHRLALEDVVNIPQRSKVEHYQDVVFVIAQLPRLTKEHDVEQISFFVGKDFVLSWRERPSNCFDSVRERIESTGRVIRESGTDYLLYALLDAVIDAYFPILEKVGNRLDVLDEEMEERVAANIVSRIHAVRHDVRLLRRMTWPLREAVGSLSTDLEWLVSKETSIYLRDCHDHTVQVIETLENYREACADLRDFYATEISNRMNEVMKVLTVIATIFIPLSFIAGVYGMNFDPEVSGLNMPELKWRWGYPIALGLMGAVAIGQLLFFRWRGWLGGGSISRKKQR
ncbi:MAG: magnesium/cobalt transporter CorA [Pirellulales bacterium]|nr:magnesium/cobalt transporter CorA [Pirellulales bacterium]